ncbi:MAG: hypothetical protein AB8D52_12315 [Gammaproteobacteria bacterium]
MRFILKAFFSLIFNRYTGVAFLAGLLVASWFIGGFGEPKPDLQRLFTESKMVTDQPPVVFIHGVLGGKLRDAQTEEEVWPGSAFNLLFGDHDRLALDIDSETLEAKPDEYEAFAIADSSAGKDFYGNIIKTLHTYGGYQEAQPGQKIDPVNKYYYPFFYDWRQDNSKTAAKLADFIDQIRKDYNNPDLKVDIVAHSMGGLITRYYLRYGRTDVLNGNDFPINMYGGERIRRVVLLGTPNLGSVKTMKAFIAGIHLGTGTINPEILATMPSLYQLMPHPLNNWIVTGQGKSLKRDLFDINLWRQFEWNIFNPEVRARVKTQFTDAKEAERHLQVLENYFEKTIERARRFVWSLTIPLPEEHPTLIVFGGDCTLTPARIVVEEVDGESLVRLNPGEIVNPDPDIDYEKLLMEPGDGAVTKASLLGRNVLDPGIPRHKYSFFPLDHGIMLCEKHNSLTGNISFQDNLLNALLIRD